jgi:hypothetical protein
LRVKFNHLPIIFYALQFFTDLICGAWRDCVFSTLLDPSFHLFFFNKSIRVIFFIFFGVRVS